VQKEKGLDNDIDTSSEPVRPKGGDRLRAGSGAKIKTDPSKRQTKNRLIGEARWNENTKTQGGSAEKNSFEGDTSGHAISSRGVVDHINGRRMKGA